MGVSYCGSQVVAEPCPRAGLTEKRVQEWDAVNHIEGWGTRFADVCGGNKAYADTIKKARSWAPHAEMWVNEGQVVVADGARLAPYTAIIEELIALGAKPDGIGFMGHYRDTDLPHPRVVYERLDHFARFGCPLQLTEFDVDCGMDEELQADYLRDIMTICFSHPKMEGIVLWGFWEGRHWRPSAALWRTDWSLKPAGKAWIHLVRNQWWTTATGRTDAKGVFNTRGFLGAYRLTVSHKERTCTKSVILSSGENDITVTLQKAD